MGTVKIRRNERLSGPYSWRTDVQLEEREREMADLGLGLGPPGSEQVLSWVTAQWLSAGSRGLSGLVVQIEQLPEMGAVLGVKGVLLGSHRVCKDRKNSKTSSKKATLLGICDNKLTPKAGNFTLVQRNVSKTAIAVVYLPFLTYRMMTVVQPHRDRVWFKAPVWYMCVTCSWWPECKGWLLWYSDWTYWCIH